MSQTMRQSGPSTAVAPDLDWSQITETVRMLNLSVAQIAMAMHEGEDSVEALTRSFTHMVERIQAISEHVKALPPEQSEVAEAIAADCAEVQGGIQQSIVAFQFYDRLSQRLDHVKHALEQLGDLVADSSRLYNPGEWYALQEHIRGRYTMREEQEMFEALVEGASVEEALERVRERLKEGDIDDIELF